MSLNKNASPPVPPLTAQRAERAGKHSDKHTMLSMSYEIVM